ncbi:hypothetical protein C447_09517 [Halococcus hamelinensis 100A6]|uniref:Uncharacterized protein n=1 Tax=Halococcus hamelinensis 100A6 TaxID=1132509 RepID=M0M194_9EURY|nr:hypothetical protein C447_09517 [Halococcus hamelinensis 100A6]
MSAFPRSDLGTEVVIRRWSEAETFRPIPRARADQTEATIRRRSGDTQPETIILDEPSNADMAMSSNESPVETCAECGESVLAAYLDDDICPACRNE